MSATTQNQTVQDRVFSILKSSAKARSNDMVLTGMYWERYDSKNVNGDIVKAMKSGDPNLTRPETIRRARQKIQSEYVDLRPAEYNGVGTGRKKALK